MKKWHFVALLGGLACGFFVSKTWKGYKSGASIYTSGFSKV